MDYEMSNFMKTYQTLLKAVLSGLLVGIVASTYLMLKDSNQLLGAFLFGFGLMTICTFDFYLFTGRIGYLIDHKPKYLITLLYIVLGNLMGLLIFAGILKMTGLENIFLNAQQLVAEKLAQSYINMFARAIICGMLMYLGVEGYKRVPNDVAKVVINMLAVMIFIFLSVEHSIANAFYFMLNGQFSLKIFVSCII